jgi:eukaryotic-like serine/threonine-protein kinase
VELEPNTLLAGRYRITAVLAEGGMGVVYRAQDQRLSRLVAIKTVRYQDQNLVIRLRREAQLLARLTHPNVVSLYDVGEHEGRPYLVTQFVDGVPLRQLLGRMTERRIAWIAEQIANGLAAAHTLGIVHRDLKPSNVLVGDGTVRLLDFGIARHINDAALTSSEALLGTAAYISPEQLAGEPAGPGADIYALGLVLIESFSGRAAFAGSFSETVAARMIEPPRLPDELPPAWHGLIGAMTDPVAETRPSAVAVAAAVRALGRPSSDATAVAPVPGPAATDTGEVPVDPRRVPLPAAGLTDVPPAPAIVPLPSGTWDEEPLRQRRNRVLRPMVLVAAAVAFGFVGVLGAAMLATARTDRPSQPVDAAADTAGTQPANTLPMTGSTTTQVSPAVTAPVTPPAPTTTAAPVTSPPTTVTVVAPPPPPPTTPKPPPPPTTTRPQPTTTLSDFRRWLCSRNPRYC